MTEPWRYACPEGHRSLKRIGGSFNRPGTDRAWRCQTCGETYATATDCKTGREVGP